MSTLTLRTGNVNLPNSSAVLGAYLATDANDGKGLTLREALAHATDTVRRAGSPQYVPSVAHKPKEVCGTICTQTIELREGAIMRFLCMLRPEWGSTQVTTNIFIMARETAALRRIKIRIGDSASLTHNTFEIVGRFEILTGEQASEEGAHVDEKFMRLGTQAMQELAIDEIEELEPEISKRRRVRRRRLKNDKGGSVVIREQKRRRGIEL